MQTEIPARGTLAENTLIIANLLEMASCSLLSIQSTRLAKSIFEAAMNHGHALSIIGARISTGIRNNEVAK